MHSPPQLSPKGLAKIDALIVPIAEELGRTYPARQSYVRAMDYWAETLGAQHRTGWLGCKSTNFSMGAAGDCVPCLWRTRFV